MLRTYPLTHGTKQEATLHIPLFEAHITTENKKGADMLVSQIKRLGVSFGIDYFRQIVNLSGDSRTGHDLCGVMITFRSYNYLEIMKRINQVLTLIAKTKMGHTLEIEKMVRDSRTRAVEINMFDFPGYRALSAKERPLYENHVGWSFANGALPTHEQIVERLLKITGVKPDQIVDFSLSEHGPINDIVISYYQTTMQNTLGFGRILYNAAKKLGATYVLKEQVCVVGVPI